MVIHYNIEPGDDPMNGLIAKVKNKKPWLIGSSIYTTSSALNTGDSSYMLTWEGIVQTDNVESAFLQINFKNLYIWPSHYSNRGRIGWQYSRKWNVYGIESSKQEILLSEDTAEETGYCGVEANCDSNDSFLYKLKNTTRDLVGIKFVPIVGSYISPYYFQSYGIELFGILSSRKTYSDCFTCKCKYMIIIDRSVVLISQFILLCK